MRIVIAKSHRSSNASANHNELLCCLDFYPPRVFIVVNAAASYINSSAALTLFLPFTTSTSLTFPHTFVANMVAELKQRSTTATKDAQAAPKEEFADANIPDDYVSRVLATEKPLPPVQLKNILSEIQWVSFLALTVTPILGIYGLFTTSFNKYTFAWSVVYYFMTGLGITAGYHRLWAHRAYNATYPLQYFLACMGSGAVQGSIHWWSRGHRAHHRYTDTTLTLTEPTSVSSGRTSAGCLSGLAASLVSPTSRTCARTRHQVPAQVLHPYAPLLRLWSPTLVAGLGWNDWRGGFFFAGMLRLVFVHHSTFCVNSLAHYLGEATFDNKMTPRDHFFTALVTVGEGYHNFHHQFPMDYRNAVQWYQFDPTKWFIASMYKLGLATHLKTFPDNEVKKGRLAMQLQKAHELGQQLEWPKSSAHLPVISWDDFVEESKTRPLIVVHGFIHDVSSFLDEHLVAATCSPARSARTPPLPSSAVSTTTRTPLTTCSR